VVTTDDRGLAALAQAIAQDQFIDSRGAVRFAAAILAAMPGWRLVPADAAPVDAERLALTKLRDSVVEWRLQAVAGAEQAKERHEWGRVDRFEGGEGYLNAVLSEINAALAPSERNER
jgi:hypothetical protein